MGHFVPMLHVGVGAGDLCFANNWQREGGRMGGKIFSSEGIGSLSLPQQREKVRREGKA